MTHKPTHSTDAAEKFRSLGPAWVRAFSAGRQLEYSSRTVDLSTRSENRSWFDAAAAWHRWHEPSVADRFTQFQRPFYLLLDRARVEQLAGARFPGMSANLEATNVLVPAEPLLQPLYLCARLLASGAHYRAGAFVEQWYYETETHPLRLVLNRWARPFGLSFKENARHEQHQALAKVLYRLLALDAWRHEVLADAPLFGSRVTPVVQMCAETLIREDSQPVKVTSEEGDTSDGISPNRNEQDCAPELESEGSVELQYGSAHSYPGYSVFTRQFDELGSASRWFERSDIQRLDLLKTIDRRRARQLAHQLQRRIQSARQRSWDFDLEEGLIDSRRLSRLVRAGSECRIFRRETESTISEAAITLMVDLSGSMRGKRLLLAALSIDLAVHVLETCGIECEVLGFTTRFGKDNPIVRRWKQSFSNRPPGRLNATRHVIFKAFREPWRRCRIFLGLMLREGFGIENIDGEALDWAARRLSFAAPTNKVLVVISDGSPFDQPTVSFNGIGFLENHLREVISEIKKSGIQVSAIGAGMDVARFYSRAIVLDESEDIISVLFNELADLIDPKQT